MILDEGWWLATRTESRSGLNGPEGEAAERRFAGVTAVRRQRPDLIVREALLFLGAVANASLRQKHQPKLHVEIVAEIELAALGIVDEEVAGALRQDFALVEQIGAVDDFEGLAHVVIGDEDTYAFVA